MQITQEVCVGKRNHTGNAKWILTFQQFLLRSIARNVWKTYSLIYATCTSPIMHLICPPKFCISIVFNFSWDGCDTQEKCKKKQTRLGNFFFWGGGGNKVHYGRCASGVFWVYGITFQRKKNIRQMIGLSIECFLILKKQTINL